jgi:hypothetical protein
MTSSQDLHQRDDWIDRPYPADRIIMTIDTRPTLSPCSDSFSRIRRRFFPKSESCQSQSGTRSPISARCYVVGLTKTRRKASPRMTKSKRTGTLRTRKIPARKRRVIQAREKIGNQSLLVEIRFELLEPPKGNMLPVPKQSDSIARKWRERWKYQGELGRGFQPSIWSTSCIQSTFETRELLLTRTTLLSNSDFRCLKIEMWFAIPLRIAFPGPSKQILDLPSIHLLYNYLLQSVRPLSSSVNRHFSRDHQISLNQTFPSLF